MCNFVPLGMTSKSEDTHSTCSNIIQQIHRQMSRFAAPSSPSMYEVCKYWRPNHPNMAAVLIPLFIKDGDIHVLLTKRAATLRHQPGDVAFPGGRKDEADLDEVQTCLRETQEEIGISPEHVEIVGKLYPGILRRQMFVVPVVGIIPDNLLFKPNPDEVEVVFSLPLRRFLSSRDHILSEIRTTPDQVEPWRFHCFDDDVGPNESVIRTWGWTAMICIQLAVAIFQQEPSFSVTFDKNDPFANVRERYDEAVESIREIIKNIARQNNKSKL